MQFTFFLLLTTIFLRAGALNVPTADEIHNLPGLKQQPSFKHYSGYLRASPTRFLHYWFVESQSSPENDPVVLWMNGGPGCSSLDGLLTEHGPYLATEHGDLRYNSQSWNRITNVLYLESPAGVGFSYATDNNITSSDDSVAQENYNALVDFFRKFPNYLQNDFYISGESYGGIYVPTLSRLVMRNETIHLKGLLVGNGLLSESINENSELYFAHYHGLFGSDLWKGIVSECCALNNTEFCMFTESDKPSCWDWIIEARSSLGEGLNPYNIYAPCYDTVISRKYQRNIPKHTKKFRPGRYSFRRIPSVGLVPTCTNDTAITDYLNSAPVRVALHIPDHVGKWDVCSGDVHSKYRSTYRDMYAVIRDLMKPKKYRILIYNGDVDMVCNFLGDEWFLDFMNMNVSDARRPWLFLDTNGERQVGGYTKAWSTGVVFATIRGAGHMVPQDLPVPSFQMFERFINNKPL